MAIIVLFNEYVHCTHNIHTHMHVECVRHCSMKYFVLCLRRHMYLSFSFALLWLVLCSVQTNCLPFVSLHFHSSNKQLNVRVNARSPIFAGHCPMSMSTHNKFTLIAHIACYLFVIHTHIYVHSGDQQLSTHNLKCLLHWHKVCL